MVCWQAGREPPLPCWVAAKHVCGFTYQAVQAPALGHTIVHVLPQVPAQHHQQRRGGHHDPEAAVCVAVLLSAGQGRLGVGAVLEQPCWWPSNCSTAACYSAVLLPADVLPRLLCCRQLAHQDELPGHQQPLLVRFLRCAHHWVLCRQHCVAPACCNLQLASKFAVPLRSPIEQIPYPSRPCRPCLGDRAGGAVHAIHAASGERLFSFRHINPLLPASWGSVVLAHDSGC